MPAPGVPRFRCADASEKARLVGRGSCFPDLTGFDFLNSLRGGIVQDWALESRGGRL